MKFITDIIVVLTLIGIGIFLYVRYWDDVALHFGETDGTATIYIQQAAFAVMVANTPQSREQGLSGVASLPQYGGMLFIFDDSAKHGFWMKDMLLPIDMLWFDESFKLIHVERNVEPSTYPTIFAPREEARFVVELNANMTDRANIALGDRLTMPPELVPQDLR